MHSSSTTTHVQFKVSVSPKRLIRMTLEMFYWRSSYEEMFRQKAFVMSFFLNQQYIT
jgi:hypothetical protein